MAAVLAHELVSRSGGSRLELASVGDDDLEHARDISSPRTSAKHPTIELGAKAAELLIDEMKSPDGIITSGSYSTPHPFRVHQCAASPAAASAAAR